MTTESPLFLIKVECPVCKTINEFENIKLGAYTEQGHDTDFCPVGREWRNSKYEVYNPLLFFMATCDHCHYTREFNKSFKEWKDDVAFKTYKLKDVKTAHLQAYAEDNSVIRMLAEACDIQTNPFGTAVVKFLLGIYDELLNERPKNLDLGRFFLRIAWLYREYYGKSDSSSNVAAHFARDIHKACARLTQTGDSFDMGLESISSLVAEQFSATGTSGDDQIEFLTLHDDFKQTLARLSELQGNLRMAMSDLHKNVGNNSDIISKASIPTANGSVRFGGFPSFENFIAEVKKRWEYAPVSETEALVFAVEFYKAALEDGHEIQPGNQAIQTSYIIAELSRRASKYLDAKQYFNSAIKAGQQYIFNNRNDKTRTALARKIVEMATEQGKKNLAAAKD